MLLSKGLHLSFPERVNAGGRPDGRRPGSLRESVGVIRPTQMDGNESPAGLTGRGLMSGATRGTRYDEIHHRYSLIGVGGRAAETPASACSQPLFSTGSMHSRNGKLLAVDWKSCGVMFRSHRWPRRELGSGAAAATFGLLVRP